MLSLFSSIVMFCCAETDNQNIRTGRAWVGCEARQEINIHCQYFLHIFRFLSIFPHCQYFPRKFQHIPLFVHFLPMPIFSSHREAIWKKSQSYWTSFVLHTSLSRQLAKSANIFLENIFFPGEINQFWC